MTSSLFAQMQAEIAACLQEIAPEIPPQNLARVVVEPPRDARHGDLATNAALVLAKPLNMAPKTLAAALAAALMTRPMVAHATVAGPGFVNLCLHPWVFQQLLPVILRKAEAYGDSTLGGGARVNVEYVSANPTGPLHVGHCRGAVVGDALANLLQKAGFSVVKEYYMNDAGAQVRALAYASYWRYLQALGTTITEDAYSAQVPGGLQYRGDYLIPVGEALKARYSDALAPGAQVAFSDETLHLVQCFAIDMMMDAIRQDLKALGVEHDVFISEQRLIDTGAADRAIDTLTTLGFIYEGTLPPPPGSDDREEERLQPLFASSRFGDDQDRALRKSDGSPTYFANDLGNHADKIARGMEQLVQVWGADHGGYVARMKAATRALSQDQVALEVVLCQIVNVMVNGVPVRMSKRAGSYITLRELIDDVGRDAVRFTMLTRTSDAQMDFDLQRVVEQSRENPVFYVQYAHARCCSVLKQAPSSEVLATADVAALQDPAEMTVLRRLAAWPRVVEAAALTKEPHRVAFYLGDLASDFHALWNRGREEPELRFVQTDHPDITHARLALVAATAMVLRSGLAVMGVAPVEHMRKGDS